jgi:hypothetical protein
MTVEKQREVIRLWNELRKLEGPAAEELRIQILECFSEKGKQKRAAWSALSAAMAHEIIAVFATALIFGRNFADGGEVRADGFIDR